MMAFNTKLVLLVCSTFLLIKFIDANVVFRFALDFHIKNGDESQSNEAVNEENISKTITLRDNQISLRDSNNDDADEDGLKNSTKFATATVGPGFDEIWAQQSNLMEVVNEKLQSTVSTISNISREIRPLVGRSDVLAAKVKLMVRYLNAANTAPSATTARIALMRRFVDLVDQLRTTDEAVSKKSLDLTLMNLVLDKHGASELQQVVQAELLQAEEAWQRYVKTKLVEVAV